MAELYHEYPESYSEFSCLSVGEGVISIALLCTTFGSPPAPTSMERLLRIRGHLRQQTLLICLVDNRAPIRSAEYSSNSVGHAICKWQNSPVGALDNYPGELRAYGLAERPGIADLDHEPGEINPRTEPALSLHRLTQQTLRAKLAQPAEDCRRLLAVLRHCCPAEAALPQHWPRYAALSPHVTQLDRYHASGWLDSREFSWLLDSVAAHLRYGPALYADSAHWLRRAWEIDRNELGEEHPNTLASMNNLASTLKAQGDLAGALELEKSALATRRRVLGEEHPATLTSMNNLAGTLHTQGDLAGALDLQRSELAICRRVLGEEHPDTLTSMNNLASTLWQMNEYLPALQQMRAAAASFAQALGPDHPHTLATRRAAEQMATVINQAKPEPRGTPP